MTLPCPNWLRVLHPKQSPPGLEITVFLPEIWRIWSQKTSAGLSIIYIFLNLLSATERFTNAFFGAVNWTIAGADAPGFFVHDARTIGNWLNLVQLGVDWVLLLLLVSSLLPYYYIHPSQHLLDYPQAIQLRLLSLDSGVVRVRDLVVQAVVLTMLAVSWVFRVSLPSGVDVLTPLRSIVWYVRVGWPAGRHGGICDCSWVLAVLRMMGRRRLGGSVGGKGETDPLMGGSRNVVEERA
ncbi:hypothetical protein ASPNIDRAFT_38060 [Aspergillus niger ATCC 1015]|uniref:Uncharacterized protein n=1 Tax=Aspergillus niger (strain ATCC 1015 / CBS 113.46 / FGSC A1144 / LSHB Ac4 / NCTC 3858a / NRRL 328 / USDA 3528.7) TaxID=380704 RepID=G3YEZ7_ASPNA|nr:hypothetical protein ASPNIDRAFT_38060 [Aspergillus niger ATCC 1015]